MPFTRIEGYGQSADRTVAIEGRTFTVPCLIEDDHGLRWFVTDSFASIAPGVWAKAAASGVVALLAFQDGSWQGLSTETFMEVRTQESGAYTVTSGWRTFATLPSYLDLIGEPVQDAVTGFVHLHVHTEMSAMDGRSRVSEIVAEVVGHGQQAVASSDHGNCAAHPRLQREADQAGLRPIFGIEAYFVHDRLRRPVEWWVEQGTETRVSEQRLSTMSVEARKKTLERRTDAQEVKNGYFHLTLLAMDDAGLRNLWAMSTESFRDGFYYVPRMDWETLSRFSEGVIALTGCLRGPVAVPVIADDEATALAHLSRLQEIFGDRLYLEIMPNDLPEQKKVNEAMVAYSETYGVPLVATVDSHYPTDDALPEHKAWVAVQTNSDVQDETDLFSHDLGLFVKSEQQVREGLAYLHPQSVDMAVDNTAMIANRCTARIENKIVMPVYSKQGGAERDAERLLDLCLSNWHLTTGKGYTAEEAIARFEREFHLLVDKQFCGYFLQVADYCSWAKSQGILVGPGRGSGGGSLVAYLAEITALDPIDGNLLFERFLTEGRESPPDFDVDFPSSKVQQILDYITEKYHKDRVVRVGTHLRLRNKGVIKDLFRAMKSQLPEDAWRDQEAISAIITAAEGGTAGLGLSWDELWAQEEEVLAPYLAKYPQVFAMAERLVGLLKSYGKHAAGQVVSTEESLVESLPLRASDEGQMITQFEMGDLERMGYIKFDILTLRTLDTIQECVDLIEAKRGIRVNVYDWKEEYLDPQVWDALGEGHTLGVFQVETASGTRLMKQMRPVNLSEFADALTLVRPGPSRSGLKDLYLARRAGESPIDFPDPRLEQVLAKTYGTLLYQEDIMATCMVLAGYDSIRADEVRSILGKKKVEKVASAGREFVAGCVDNGMDREAAEHLWEQMAEFAKYSFNRAHAYGYAVLAYWTAWLKVHYPIEFFSSVLSTVKPDRVPEFVSEARRMGFQIKPPDINESGAHFTAMPLGVRYGLRSIKTVGDAALAGIIPGQPYSSFEDFRERSGADSGVVATLAKIGAFDQLVPNRRGLQTMLLREKTGEATACRMRDTTVSNVNDLPCTLDWSSEPPPVNPRTGKNLKPKPPPKRCTKACRQYWPQPPFDVDSVEPYTDEDVRNIEMEVLGIHLSSTVFDAMTPEDRALTLAEAERIVNGPQDTYVLAGSISRIRPHTDRSGKKMAFLGVVTEVSDLDVVVFARDWEHYQQTLKTGTLVLLEVRKNERGISLVAAASL